MSLKVVEVGGMSLGESDCNLNERTYNEEIINLEVTQQSLSVASSKGRSSEGFSESCQSTSEPSGSWGDFEGFKESLNKSERFSYNFEVLVKSTKTSRVDMDFSKGCCSASAGHVCSEPCPHSGLQEASSSLQEVRVNSKPKTRTVCVTASTSQDLYLKVSSGEDNSVQGERLSSHFAADWSGTKAAPLRCLTNT